MNDETQTPTPRTDLGYWEDDGQITDGTLRKRVGEHPGVVVTISRPSKEPLRLKNYRN